MNPFHPKKILVPVDFSEMSLDNFRAAAVLTSNEDAEIHLLHVAEDRNYVGEFASSRTLMSRVREDAYRALESQLEILANKVSTPAKVVITLIWGDPAKDIVHIAEAGDFDLIVMATHGRKGLNRFFMGSVTEEVMRRAPCSVLALRAMAKEQKKVEMEKEMAAAV